MEPKEEIKKEADKIRKEIIGGTLFGEPIDPTDQDALLVAAYGLGMWEIIQENQKLLDLFKK